MDRRAGRGALLHAPAGGSAHDRVFAPVGPAALVFAVLVTVSLAVMGALHPHAAFAGQAAGSYESGVYSIDGTVRQAQADRESMADAAFVKPLELIVSAGEATLDAEIVPTSGQYLGELGYYEAYAGSAAPKDERAEPVTVRSTYDNGYPHEVSFPIDTSLDVQWLKVYIPFMEDLSAGSGTQYVRLVLDYGTMKRTGDAPDNAGDAQAGASGSSGSPASPGSSAPSDAADSSSSSQGADSAAGTASDAYYELLADTIATADGYLAKTGVYTADSLSRLRAKRDAAKKMHDAHTADALSIVIAIGDVRWGVQLLDPISGGELDFADLPDGTYTLVGSMVKADKATLSMADGALDHNITVKVADGAYHAVVGLGSVSMNGKAGYLGALRYYKSGYRTNAAGGLEGSTAKAKVLSYQTTSAGARVSDEYGTDYPSAVRIPVIAEAKKDGYVPLSMYVPVMESISKGAGTQAAYLKLETDKVYAGEQDVAPASAGTPSPAESGADPAGAGSGASPGASTLPGSAPGASASAGSGASPAKAGSSSGGAGEAANAKDDAQAARQGAVSGTGGAEQADADEAAKVTVISPAAKEAPLKGAVPGMAVAAVALAVVVLGGVAFRKRNGLFK